MKLRFTRKQKIRIVQDSVEIYTTYGKVVPEQFADIGIYDATIAALAEIQSLRDIGHAPILGISGNFAGRAIQVDLI